MLRFLSIRHLAVIESVEVEFSPGLNVLTGETGAGKSILVEAVGLLLGGRSSADLIRTGQQVATIEAVFEDGADEILLKREITAQGKSRASVNGSLATAGGLRSLSARLVELHGQHEHQALLDPSTHIGFLDAFGAPPDETRAVADAFDRLRRIKVELEETRRNAADQSARQELVAFQLGELDRADPKDSEDQHLGTLRDVLAGAERVTRLCEESYAALYESDTAALATLGTVWRRVGELASLEPQFVPYLEARDDIKARLDDLARFLRQYADHIDASPDRLHGVQERLALLERLKRKYGPTLEDVIEKRAALRRQLEGLENVDDRLARLEQDCASAREAFLLVARKLSSTRRTLADSFARQLERALAGVAMDRARFEVRFSDVAEEGWSASGIDQIEFYVSANPGEDLRPLAAIVSGGELSRVMLAMKSLTVETRADSAEPGAPALIFDEVDAGIGGRVADVVGQKLRSLGSAFQVLCITHLPQIAACADAHFLIDKRVADGRTHTSITRLDDTQRVDEIGRMLAGTTITDAVRASARELLTKGNRKGLRNSRAGESERAKAKVARRTL